MSSTSLDQVAAAADSMLISSGGSLVQVDSTGWQTVQAIVYPSDQVKARQLVPQKVWLAAQAGDTSIGLEVVLEDHTGRVLAGPATTFGGSVPQLMALMPLRATAFPTRSVPTVLVLRARNRKQGGPPSLVGQLAIELSSK